MMAGETHYLWRAVDHEDKVLEAYVTKARDKAAALEFLKNAIKRYGNPKDIGNQAKQKAWLYLHNRIENSHLTLRRREQAMMRYRRVLNPQKLTAMHTVIHNCSHGQESAHQ